MGKFQLNYGFYSDMGTLLMGQMYYAYDRDKWYYGTSSGVNKELTSTGSSTPTPATSSEKIYTKEISPINLSVTKLGSPVIKLPFFIYNEVADEYIQVYSKATLGGDWEIYNNWTFGEPVVGQTALNGNNLVENILVADDTLYYKVVYKENIIPYDFTLKGTRADFRIAKNLTIPKLYANAESGPLPILSISELYPLFYEVEYDGAIVNYSYYTDFFLGEYDFGTSLIDLQLEVFAYKGHSNGSINQNSGLIPIHISSINRYTPIPQNDGKIPYVGTFVFRLRQLSTNAVSPFCVKKLHISKNFVRDGTSKYRYTYVRLR